MSFRSWLSNPTVGSGLIFAGLLAMWFSANYYNQTYREDRGTYQHDQRALEGVGPSRVPPVGSFQAPVRNPQPDREEWRKEQDLEAQNKMAKWALVASIAAFIGAAVTAIGVVFVRQTLVATQQQLRLSRHALTSTERAFVYLKENRSELLRDAEQNHAGRNMTVIWVNGGKTPTRFCYMNTNLLITRSQATQDFDFPDTKWTGSIMAPLGPADTVQTGKVFIPQKRVNAVRAGTEYAYFFGWIEYNDVFENTPRHRSEFAYSLTFETDGSVFFDPMPRHNGSDEECYYQPRTRPPTDRPRPPIPTRPKIHPSV